MKVGANMSYSRALIFKETSFEGTESIYGTDLRLAGTKNRIERLESPRERFDLRDKHLSTL